MTPTAESYERWGRSGYSRLGASQFGTSSRGGYRPLGDDDDDDDDDDRASRGTFRTLCVRLCDGYYWPISFSVTRDRLQRDAAVCESSCGEQARLFVYPNPGGAIEDMQDLQGRPYRQLRTAFLYRSEYLPACKCQPHPWEDAARDRHRVYALVATKRRGDKSADKELAALAAKRRDATEPAGRRTASLSAPSYDGEAAPSAAQEQRMQRGDTGERQRSARPRSGGAEARSRQAPAEPRRQAAGDDWRRRIFNGN